MRLAHAFALVFALVAARPAEAAKSVRRAPDAGADLSSLPVVEAGGARFHDGKRTGDALALLRRAGFTSVRLRLWHSPEAGACDLASTLRMARRAQELGLSVLLDIHYSDTWADPGHQAPPLVWRGLGREALGDSVFAYSRDAVAALVAQGTTPEAVQIGNEIDAGLLWDTARVEGAFDTPAQWRNLTFLLGRAAAGVRAAAPTARIALHLSPGGSTARCVRVLDRCVAAGVPFDAIGISYYPWWHGPIDSLRANLAALSARYRRNVFVAETAYPWTLAWFDATHNVVGTRAQLVPGFPATPEGQAAFAREVRRAVEDVPAARGTGVWWWEPAWMAAPGAGSPWENCALFDSSGALLPAAAALAR